MQGKFSWWMKLSNILMGEGPLGDDWQTRCGSLWIRCYGFSNNCSWSNPLLWVLARAVFDKCTQNTNYMVRREFIGKRESRTRLVSFCCPSCVKAKLVSGFRTHSKHRASSDPNGQTWMMSANFSGFWTPPCEYQIGREFCKIKTSSKKV